MFSELPNVQGARKLTLLFSAIQKKIQQHFKHFAMLHRCLYLIIVNNTGATCTSTEFKCQEPGNSSICITQDFVNDKIANCEDKSDEFGK